MDAGRGTRDAGWLAMYLGRYGNYYMLGYTHQRTDTTPIVITFRRDAI